MRQRFDDFDISQLKCLIKKFSQIYNLSEVNQECFGGSLFDPKIIESIDGTSISLNAND